MNRGLVVADRSGQAWSSFKAKKRSSVEWSGFASFPTPPFQFTHISNLTSLTFDFLSNTVFFLQFAIQTFVAKILIDCYSWGSPFNSGPNFQSQYFSPNYASAKPYFQFPNSISNLNRARAICHLRCPKLLPRPNINSATSQCLAMKQLMPANIYKRKYNFLSFSL